MIAEFEMTMAEDKNGKRTRRCVPLRGVLAILVGLPIAVVTSLILAVTFVGLVLSIAPILLFGGLIWLVFRVMR